MEQPEMEEQIGRIRKTYSDAYASMTWLTPATAETAERRREKLISGIFSADQGAAGWKYAGTKLFTHAVSPGCDLCGKGGWSCLFINGICNANCFYCPSSQKDMGQPVTSTVAFSRAEDYADYVERFSIKGASFSGGEPLMTFDRVLAYLKVLRKRLPRSLYIWMYTNGLLVTRDKLKCLRDNGLDEIRFDLSANRYRLDSLEKAVGIIPAVTVEIPAVPEDLDRTKQVIRDLWAAGADYLNLHQIRCTPFNRPHLEKRGYTFLHGPGVTVLETELAALELIRYALEQNISLPVNYCSFTFRHQFQAAGARARNARLLKKTWEDLTPTGYIRSMGLWGDPDLISRLNGRLLASGTDTALWQLNKKGDHLDFSARIWPLPDVTGLRLNISYSTSALKSAVSYRHPFTEVTLNGRKKVVVERNKLQPGFRLEGPEINAFGNAYLEREAEDPSGPPNSLPRELAASLHRFEAFTPGLAPYF